MFKIICITFFAIIASSCFKSPVAAWEYNFNNGEEGWTASGEWKYTKIDDVPDNANVPYFSSEGDYFWSQSVDSEISLISPNNIEVTSTTRIYIRHWFYTNNASADTGIIIYKVYPSQSFSLPLQTMINNTDWSVLEVVNCKLHKCCTFYPCIIQLGISSSVGVQNEGIAAIQCISDDPNACGNDSVLTTSSIDTSTLSSTTSPTTTGSSTPSTTTTEAPPPSPIDNATIVLLSITCALVIAIFIIMLYYMCCRKSKVITRDRD